MWSFRARPRSIKAERRLARVGFGRVVRVVRALVWFEFTVGRSTDATTQHTRHRTRTHVHTHECERDGVVQQRRPPLDADRVDSSSLLSCWTLWLHVARCSHACRTTSDRTWCVCARTVGVLPLPSICIPPRDREGDGSGVPNALARVDSFLRSRLATDVIDVDEVCGVKSLMADNSNHVHMVSILAPQLNG
jgi:hypothetical protein